MKHYASNIMYGAQIPKGHQTNLPKSKFNILEYTSRVHNTGYAVTLAQKKTFKNDNFVQKFV